MQRDCLSPPRSAEAKPLWLRGGELEEGWGEV